MTRAKNSRLPIAVDDDGLTQSERNIQAVQELECCDDPERFRDQVQNIARAKGKSFRGAHDKNR